jgi:AcrR family transcriptional regulator
VGLRERNAAQTRELILDTALALFLDQGFEVTTMEQVAERADIGTSTLYRYFPTKDQLVIEPLAIRGQMAAELRARPPEEPLDLALGHALRALVTTARPRPSRVRQIFAVLDEAPAPRARLREDFARERDLLQEAIAERLGRPGDDLFSAVTARITTLVLELLGESHGRDVDDVATTAEAALRRAEQILESLHDEPPVLPRLDSQL